MAWKKGPLPPGTYNWGGVVTRESEASGGFFFADFCGDHVKGMPGDLLIKAEDVVLYDNSLELPPKATPVVKGRVGQQIYG
jgi:hypothetical protein